MATNDVLRLASDQKAVQPVLPTVLVIDDDRQMAELLSIILRNAGHEVVQALTIGQARSQIKERFFPIILCDINLGEGSGIELMSLSNEEVKKPLFIFITGEAAVGTAMEAIHKGAFEYLSKSSDLEQLEREVVSTIERATKRLSADSLPSQAITPCSTAPIKRIIGKSARMVEVYRTIANAALHQGNVLIRGETGTGKEQIARTIHDNSQWAENPFVAVNCGALADTLLESELFGHVKGSFTGATNNKRGLFEEAIDGTIFLDEIGDISMPLQVKLLRAIQEKEIKPVGSSETKRINVRVIAATNRNLELALKESKFREDLYFRLNLFLVEVPPLRERLEDIPELVEYFIVEASSKVSKNIAGLSKEVLDLLMKYSWPGNVRELENVVTRAVVSARSTILFPEDFPRTVFETGAVDEVKTPPSNTPDGVNPNEPPPTLAKLERDYILSTLRKVNYRKVKAAEILGIDRVTLYRKITRYGISANPNREV